MLQIALPHVNVLSKGMYTSTSNPISHIGYYMEAGIMQFPLYAETGHFKKKSALKGTNFVNGVG